MRCRLSVENAAGPGKVEKIHEPECHTQHVTAVKAGKSEGQAKLVVSVVLSEESGEPANLAKRSSTGERLSNI